MFPKENTYQATLMLVLVFLRKCGVGFLFVSLLVVVFFFLSPLKNVICVSRCSGDVCNIN